MGDLVLLEYQNLINPESISIISILLSVIYFLVKERDAAKVDLKIRIDDITDHYEGDNAAIQKRVDDYVLEIAKLHEDKYKVTREIIPLLIKLIDKLNEDDKS